ncbi:hypothetical protein [Clostridium sp. UBA2485]|nr:hypothetical protein [Clostridium sp. UBA2485]
MDVEELVLKANSKNTFEPIVSSLKYPEDVVYYYFNNNICEDNTTTRNGFITRRYDPISGNDAPQDWRTMLWARWTPDSNQYYKNGTLTNYSVWTSGVAQLNTIYKADGRLWVASVASTPTSATDGTVFYPIYDDLSLALLLGDETVVGRYIKLKKGTLKEVKTFNSSNCINNKISSPSKGRLHNNVFYYNCYGNILGNDCHANTFGTQSYTNILGNYCYGNIFMTTFVGNKAGNNFNNNNFCGHSRYNIFGNNIYSNIFHLGFGYSHMGNYCWNNYFLANCTYNVIGNGCYSNFFGMYTTLTLQEVINGKDFTNIENIKNQRGVTIQKTSDNKVVYIYINSSKQMVITEIP